VTPAPVGTLRDSLAFIRDPGRFTAFEGRALGDYYRLRLPGRNLHVVTHPSVIEEILVSRGPHFDKSRLYWGELRRIIGEAMASLEGARWRYLRKLEQPYFTHRATERYLPTAGEIITDELDELQRASSKRTEIPVLEITSRLNTRIILALLFGQEAGGERLEITRRIVDGEDTIAWRSRFPWRRWTGWLNGRNMRASGHKKFFDRYARKVGASEAASRDDIMLGALQAMRTDPDAPDYPEALLRNEMIVHLGASTETQGVAEGWCLYLLWKHPETLAQLRQEVRDVAGVEPVRPEHLPQLVYAEQVIRETLRLFPTAYGVVRDCVEETEVAGERVHPGQIFFISLVGLHRSPRFWDDPDRFDPSRFRLGYRDRLDKHQYMPFGGGRQVCIGQHLALPVMILAIAQIAQRFDWRFTVREIAPVGLATLKPSGPFRAVFTPRTAA
jgi:cytochrome P450